MSMIDSQIWQSVLTDVTLNPDAAIYKLWVSYRDNEQYLGVPITHETDVGNGVIQQGFSSGAVIQWDATNGAKLVSSS